MKKLSKIRSLLCFDRAKGVVCAAFTLFSFILFAGRLPADLIALKNGNLIEGRVISEDEAGLTLDVGMGQIILLKSTIESIERKPFESIDVISQVLREEPESSTEDENPPAALAPSQIPANSEVIKGEVPGHLSQEEQPPSKDIFAPEYFSWPPKVGEKYPDLLFLDHKGRHMKMSSFRGKIIIVEPVGIRWPASEDGGRRVKRPRISWEGMKELKKYLTRTRQILLPDEHIIYIQIVLFDANLEYPSLRDIQNWVQRYDFRQSRGEYVFITDEDLSGPVSYSLLPGFQLIDKDFVLRADSTGENPLDDLFEDLVPLVKKLRTEIK